MLILELGGVVAIIVWGGGYFANKIYQRNSDNKWLQSKFPEEDEIKEPKKPLALRKIDFGCDPRLKILEKERDYLREADRLALANTEAPIRKRLLEISMEMAQITTLISHELVQEYNQQHNGQVYKEAISVLKSEQQFLKDRIISITVCLSEQEFCYRRLKEISNIICQLNEKEKSFVWSSCGGF
jgi:hypothetical protein